MASSLHEAPGPLSKHKKIKKINLYLSLSFDYSVSTIVIHTQLLSSFDDSATEISDGKKMRSKSHSFQTRNSDLIGQKKTIITESPLNERDSEMFKENRPNKSREKISEKLSKFPSSTIQHPLEKGQFW